MSQTTILVIDDSATIRKLVDSHLSQEGYRVVLAATAEEGLRKAAEVQPDLIILDHQLPGTTGSQVYRQLTALPGCEQTPVIVTSTLRKKAYAEYLDLPNVVDSLPKPFSPELLKTTVANALETGSLVVSSQARGTAVPEVIEAISDTSLAGSFPQFSLREVLDFLNNGGKSGALEVESDRDRTWFFLNGGHIQAVIASAVDPQQVAVGLPESLRDLGPLLRFTVNGGSVSQMSGLVELLDKKVLDPRLLRGLLRHQAAILTRRCFTGSPKSFSFEAGRVAPPFFCKLPLDMSLSALLVEGAMVCPKDELPREFENTVYLRRTLRGQNLDRTGLAATHMRVLSLLEEPISSEALAQKLGWSPDEARRVLHGFVLAEWVQMQAQVPACYVVALEPEPAGAQRLRALLEGGSQEYVGKVVRDQLGLQILLRRKRPELVVLAIDEEQQRDLARSLRESDELRGARFIGIVAEGAEGDNQAEEIRANLDFDAVIGRPYTEKDVLDVFNRVRGLEDGSSTGQAEDVPRDQASSSDTDESEAALTGAKA